MVSLKSASGFLIGLLEKVFYRWGVFTSKHPYPVILVSLLVTALCAIGFVNFRQEHQADKLWIPPWSEYLVNKRWLSGNFQGKHRTEFLLFQKDNVLTPEAIQQMWEIHKKISEIKIHGFTFNDICSKIPVGDIFHTDSPSPRYECTEDPTASANIDKKANGEDREKDSVWPDYYDYGEDDYNTAASDPGQDDLWTDYYDYENDDSYYTTDSAKNCTTIIPRIDFELYGKDLPKLKKKTTTTTSTTTTSTTTTSSPEDNISAASLVLSSTSKPKKEANEDEENDELPIDVYCNILQSLQEKCAQFNLLEIWKYNETLIYSTTQQEIIDAVNLLERNPWNSHRAHYLGSLGSKTRNASGHTIAAKSVQMYWQVKIPDGAILVKNQGSGLELEPADQVTLDWEKAFVEIALNTTFPGVSMYPHAARSYSDVSTDAIFFDAIKLASGYMLMFIYTILMLGKLNAVEVKMYLAITGIASVGMGLMIGMGLSSALGFPYTPMHPAMPFLALGIGIDDMFVIVQCWNNVKKQHGSNIEISEAIGQGLKHAGVSVTITTLTDVFAFAIGSISRMPGLSAFCVSCAIALAAIYLLQVTWFVAFLALDEKRIAAKRHGIVPCVVKNDYNPTDMCNREALFAKFMKAYTKMLSNWIYKAAVIVTTLTLLGFGVWGATEIEQKFDPILLLPKGSYLRKWTEVNSEMYPTNGWSSVVYTGKMNYSNLPYMDKLMDDLQDVVNQKTYLKSRGSWWLDLKKWALKNHKADTVEDIWTEKDFPMILSEFLHSSDGAKHKRNFEFEGNLTCGNPAPPIKVSKFSVGFPNFAGPSEHIPAKRLLEDMVNKSKISERAFSHVKIYAAWETDEIIGTELYRNIGLALVAVVVVTLVLLTNFQICFMVFCCVILTLVDIVGFLHFWEMTIDIISCVSIVLAIGLCVDYSVHIGHAFLIAPGSRLEKAVSAIETIGPAVFNGGFTTFLALSLLSLSQSNIFITFFKVFFLTVVFGLFHGLLMLPVMLSILGPQSMDENGSNAPISSPTSSVSPAPSEHHSPAPAGQLGKQGQRNLSYIQDNVISIISENSLDEEKGGRYPE
eukprot:TRINITY_DN4294_c0_g1_i7.p1 TRINITY_DN4294_c0_g1~~TRINITY_DN4294_c0_g1_i7.p1  ORF type:complete len:1080 (-),score=273.26 TRINITY_DN4294_c0_g1_i7:86-3325(-)